LPVLLAGHHQNDDAAARHTHSAADNRLIVDLRAHQAAENDSTSRCRGKI